jgi:excisionase family DNA binding protein
MSQKLFTPQQAADALNLSLSTIRRWVSKRRINIVKLGRGRGGRNMIPETEVDRIIDAHRIEAREDVAV